MEARELAHDADGDLEEGMQVGGAVELLVDLAEDAEYVHGPVSPRLAALSESREGAQRFDHTRRRLVKVVGRRLIRLARETRPFLLSERLGALGGDGVDGVVHDLELEDDEIWAFLGRGSVHGDPALPEHVARGTVEADAVDALAFELDSERSGLDEILGIPLANVIEVVTQQVGIVLVEDARKAPQAEEVLGRQTKNVARVLCRRVRGGEGCTWPGAPRRPG
jgi:hypothetical protein